MVLWLAGCLAPKILRGDKVVLRPPRWRDSRSWCNLRLVNQVMLRSREPEWTSDAVSARGYRRYLREQTLAARYDLGYAFFIWNASFSVLKGAVHLSHIRRGAAQMGSLGYWLGAAYQGQGIMREAVALVCRFGFDEVGLHRIEAACMVDNIPSQRVLLQNGFAHEGRAQNYLEINGKWESHDLFGLIQEDMK